MHRTIRLLTISALFQLCATILAIGQDATPTPLHEPSPQAAPLHYDCSKEKDPFASYCEDVNNFLSRAATHQTQGKLDRTDTEVRAALVPFLDMSSVLGAGSDPTRFSSLRARDIAIQDAIQNATQNAKGILSSGVNQNRPDQQTGAGSNISGTTSLVEKAGAPAILAFALESGALTRSVSGNTATLRGNADGLFRAVTGKQVLCFDCPGAMGTPALRDISLSAAFQINQQGTSSVSTSGAANPSTPSVTSVMIPTSVGKLSNLTARYQLRNPYDPRSTAFRTAWNTAVVAAKKEIDDKATALEKDLGRLLVSSPIKSDEKFREVLELYRQTFYDDADARDLTKLRKDFLELYDTTVATLSRDDPQFNQKITNVNFSLARYKELWNQILNNAKGQPLLTLEYSFNRPQSQPETHDFRLIYGYSPVSPALGLFSLNAAISIYGSTIPSGAKYGRLHDGQISGEFDRSIAIGANPNQASLSLAAYWQYQPNPSVLNITAGSLAPGTNIQLPGNAQVLLGTAGSLWVTQAKVTINARSGIKIPIAIKWSNKTDLLAGKKIGAQVGISYDFSSLSSLFGGSGGA